ncbi:MAG TPA: LytTR family DNA-binding domain-containing protein [Allosphingosinicella sp.]|nr:LytTR family DNA-binding domain-containing protein [Allosphingosinicella sp.]
MLACGLSLCLSLSVQPHEASAYELLYYTFYNVAAGALVGFYLFDRLLKDGFALFAVRAASAILFGTLINEMVVEPFVFGTGPINGVGVYYGVTDSVSWAGIFLLVRLAEWLRVLRQRSHPEPETRVGPHPGATASGPAEADADCFFVRVANRTYRIHAPDVVYMKAERDFTRIVCANGEHFVSESLKSLLNRSAKFGLIRVHKSFAVNLSRVERLTRTEVRLGDCQVPVGRRYRAAFVETWRTRSAPFEGR